ncbi:ABC transporter [Marinitenerispora sediminis]|uniref:ABC transporter n=1 Tax=Marinitenerispora sediminis TaxID=1931232 RepID=A0A368T1B3_9ACTN|nr:ABC transporter [Marinitenerispora sediminis]RCV50669.1 ABC transporter [Marinitenerispora sediminis]RCV54155.1 ABC transporter [Marinitenerispora sediminis]RCV54893.1 ABC transporter [Marinitenerispora sediminis]
MTALVGYRLALLLRSARWVPPALLWAVILGIGSSPGQPFAEVLAYNSMALVPAAAWLARSVLLLEPDASRAVLVAARGAVRVHLATLLAVLPPGLVLAVLGIGAAAATAGGAGPGGAEAAGWPVLAAAALATGLACVLVGAAVGSLCTTLLARRPAIAIPATGVLAVVALIAGGSPANAAVNSVVDVPAPEATSALLTALAVSVAVAAAAAAVTAWLTVRRS